MSLYNPSISKEPVRRLIVPQIDPLSSITNNITDTRINSRAVANKLL
jgi:hypothetical protein